MGRIVLTGLFVFGMPLRRGRTAGRMGIDSLAVLATAFANRAVLRHVR